MYCMIRILRDRVEKGDRVMRLLATLILFIFATFYLHSKDQEDWTWSYRKCFRVSDAKSLSEKNNVIYSKEKVPKFTQLIFSWNAHRPEKGFLRFFVQSRNSITKQWGQWYKMADWGKDAQHSHCIKDGDCNYLHVRLEVPEGKLADGFRIKIEAHEGATLSTIRMLSVCISDLAKFGKDSLHEYVDKLDSVHIKKIPKISQMKLDHEHNTRMCSPTSMCMLVGYLTKKEIDPIDFALKSYDNGLEAYGSWPFNTAHAFERCSKYFFRVVRLPSFKDLHSYLMRGMPVVVSVRGSIPSGPQSYPNGHLILIAGWNKKNKKVICHDPAFKEHADVAHEYDIKGFCDAWRLSHHLSMVPEPAR